MRATTGFFFVILALTSSIGFSDETILARFVTRLSNTEIRDSMAISGDFLFVSGQSGLSGGRDLLKIYDVREFNDPTKNESNLKARVELTLSHTAEQISAFAKDSVLIVGKTVGPWTSHMTIVNGDGIQRTYSFPMPTESNPNQENYLVDWFGGTNSSSYFSLGANGNLLTNTQPSLRSRNGEWTLRWRELNTELRGVRQLIDAGDFLYVVEQFNILDKRTYNLARFHKATGTIDRTFNDRLRHHLTGAVYLRESNKLIVSEQGENQLLIVDVKTNRLENTIPSTAKISLASPKGLTLLGKCLVSLSFEQRVVSFIDLEDNSVVSQWNLTETFGDFLKRGSSIAIDERTGRVFVKSAFFCSNCTAPHNSVVSVEEKDSVTLKKCTNAN